MKRTASFTFRMPPELKEQLQVIADEERRTMASLVEKVLWDYVAARRKS